MSSQERSQGRNQGRNPGRSLAKFVRRYLAGCWGRLVAVSLLARGLAAAVTVPLIGATTWLLLATAGTEIVADQDLLLLAANPLAWLTGIVAGGALIGIAALEQACLITMVHGSSRGIPIGVLAAIGFTLARAWPVLRLATRIVVRIVLVAVPFVLVGAVVYAVALSEFDINYYLQERPPAFRAALAAGAVLGAALAALVVRILVRASFAVPVLLFEDLAPPVALAESARRAAGAWRSILARAGAWLGASALVSAAGAFAVWAVARLLNPVQTDSVLRLVVALGATLAALGVIQVLISAAQAAALAATAVSLYEDHGMPASAPDAGRPAGAAAHASRLDVLARAAPRRLTLRVLATLVALAFGAGLGAGAWLIADLEIEERTTITAHRGASAAAPENTLAAVRQALADGADWVEIDVQRTGDGRVVVIHDADLKRVGGAPARVGASTLAALREHDVGAWFAPGFAGERLPTLEEVLETCRGRAGVNIELKYYGADPELAVRVVEIVEAQQMTDQVVAMSLDAGAVAQLKALRPHWTVGLLSAVVLGDLTRVAADFLAVNASLATRAFVRKAHARGKAVSVWTVNDALGMTLLASRGVDSIITDRPALARAVLEERRAMGPAQRLLVNVALILGFEPPAAGSQ